MDWAFWYVTDNGIATQWRYPYTGRDGKCGYKKDWNAFQNKDCAEIPGNSTKSLQSAVVKQPVSISI